MKISAFSISLFFLFNAYALACSCQFLSSDFYESVSKSDKVVSVVLGRVKEYDENFVPLEMQFEVSTVFRGSMATGTISVQGDNGFQCRPYLSQFPLDTEWVLALFIDSEKKNYYLSNCGVFWIAAKDFDSQKLK